MRDIKFKRYYKGRRNGKSTWKERDGEVIVLDGKLYEGEGYGNWVDLKDVVVQYTGFKDKNGVEIYEGDIVRSGLKERDHTQGVVKTSIYEVHDMQDCGSQEVNGWHIDGEWILNDGRRFKQKEGLVHLDIVEVIGNVYENPELLKDCTKN